MRDNSLFQVSNHHHESCGTPPHLNDDDPNTRIYYARNPDGDQYLFVYEVQTQTGLLYGGDIGWNTPRPVVNGQLQDQDIELRVTERLWLIACWALATGVLPNLEPPEMDQR